MNNQTRAELHACQKPLQEEDSANVYKELLI